jgi:AcrR family transcriptional regulator
MTSQDYADAQIRDQVRLALELDVQIRELPDGLVPGHISAEQAAALRQSVEARLEAVLTGEQLTQEKSGFDPWLERVQTDEATTVWFDGHVADLGFDGPAEVSGDLATVAGSWTSSVRMYHMQDGVRETEVSIWPMHFVATVARAGDRWLVSNIVETFASPSPTHSS